MIRQTPFSNLLINLELLIIIWAYNIKMSDFFFGSVFIKIAEKTAVRQSV
jgi:hypothetical protein